jgi:hypothetical protein
LLNGSAIALTGFNIWLTDRDLHKELLPFHTLLKWGAKIGIIILKDKPN